MQGLQEITLNRREFDIRAVTSFEAFDFNRHFLTFERRADTAYKNDIVITLQLGDGLLIINGALLAQVEFEVCIPCLHIGIKNLYFVFLSFLHRNHATRLSGTPCVLTL